MPHPFERIASSFASPIIGALTIVVAGMIVPAVPCTAADVESDLHAHHHHMIMQDTVRSMVDYEVPHVYLIRDDGKRISLPDELDDGHAVALNFIFTTCTAVCPVTSKVFSQLQSKLGSRGDKVHLVSVSIDPEHDTPPVLRSYAEKFGAGEGWRFYTGTVEASIATQQAFGVYRGDKMNHMPVTLLRSAPGKPWLRIDGFATADELLDEIGEMLAAK